MKHALLCAAVGLASLTALPEAGAQATPFVGQITPTIASYCPRGWANANGQLLAIAEYDALFSLYGTIYGGNGTTNFALPDLRGRMAGGQGSGPGLTTRVQGSMYGQDDTTLSTSQMAQHTHTMASSSSAPTMPEIQNGVLGTFPAGVPAYAPGNSSDLTQTLNPQTVGSTGGSQPVPLQQPYAVVNYCVALFGIYPSRS